MSSSALFNGGEVPDLSRHRGLNYGDGVFRTCLIYKSQVIDIKEQCDIINGDAAGLGLAPVPAAVLEREAAQLAAGQARGVLKVVLMRAGSGRGYRGADAAGTDRLLCRYAAPDYRAALWDSGVTAFRANFRLATQPALAGLKHLNRLEQVLASRSWEAGADEALLADEAGRPVCGTRTNLFWVADGALHTPALERCGVAGLMRRKVLAQARALGIEARVRDGRWEELEGAAEAFLTNSLIGIWPLARVGARRWPAPGPVTRRLIEGLAHPRWAAG
jgi:4-amino-4-deoxychorismate lyase